MSYSGLVADAHHAQAAAEQFFDQVILLVVQRGAAQVTNGLGVRHHFAVLFLDEGALAALPDLEEAMDMVADRVWESRERTFVEKKDGDVVAHADAGWHQGRRGQRGGELAVVAAMSEP